MTETTAIAVRQPPQAANALSLYTPEAVQATMAMAKALVASRLTPRGLDTPEKAFYVIMKGRELGVPPVRALERIHIIEGKTCMAAELMLERFKQRGGRGKWITDTKTEQAIHLKAPNGDEHTESFTWEDATRAGLAGKDNWRKWPKAMMRARAISAGLRAMGEAEGMYDPDEMGAVTNEDGEIVAMPQPTGFAPVGVTRSGAFEVEADEPLDGEGLEMVDVFDADTGEKVGQQPKATDGQLRKLHALRGELRNNMNDEKFRKRLIRTFSKDSTTLLAKSEAARLIDALEKMAGKQQARLERATEAMAQDAAALGAEDAAREPGSDDT